MNNGFANKLGDIKKSLEKDNYYLTKFLDLEEQSVIMTLPKNIYHIEFFGGTKSSERKRAIIYKSDIDIDYDLFNIELICSSFDKKFSEIGHRNVLGSIMALGIDRNVFGDIIVDDKIIVCISSEIKDYIIANLSQICHQRMDWELVDASDIKEDEPIEKVINVASMRLDAVISRALNLSRNETCDYINAGMIFINHQECKNPAKNLKIDDVLSIRKYGRIIIKELLGTTKKDRLTLKIGVKH